MAQLYCIFIVLLSIARPSWSGEFLLAPVGSAIANIELPDFLRMNATSKPVCMDELGCFGFDGPFARATWRPVQFAPEPREKINTTFTLFTRKNPQEAQFLKAHDDQMLSKSNFVPTKPTKIIIHGFMEWHGSQPTWMFEMMEKLLLNGDYNVILVDWRGGNFLPYFRAVTNARIVGAEIALLVHYLMNTTNAKPSSFHLIGHSLGGQTAGYAGERIPNLGRITGLDPAGPGFQGMPPQVNLDPSDADFVDVIHTNIESTFSLGFGTIDPSGHVDFYPNGALSHPGCSRLDPKNFLMSFIDQAKKMGACEHQRSVDFFVAAMNSNKCQLIGYVCPSYDDFARGRCAACGRNSRNCVPLGIAAESWKQNKVANKSMLTYLSTYKNEPFCKPYYAIEITMGSDYSDIGGDTSITLIGASDQEEMKLPQNEADKRMANKVGFLIFGSKVLGPLKGISLKWTPAAKTANVYSWFSKADKLKIESVEIKQMHMMGKESVTRYCMSAVVNAGETVNAKETCRPQTF